MRDELLFSEARGIMRGGYDLHVHALPSHFPREWNDIEVAVQYDECEFGGFLTKSHYDSTAGRARLACETGLAKTEIYGGVALNRPVGGLNPFAVESCLKLGGKIVWMPTRDSENCLRYGKMDGDFFDRDPVAVTGVDGKLVPEVYDILDAVKKYNGWLATGHVGPEEAILICKEGCKRGVNMILTHPDWNRTIVPLELQKELARIGVMVEKIWGNVIKGHISAENMAYSIKELGGKNVFLVTDLGQKNWPRPVDGMTDFIMEMLKQGISSDELREMVYTNPGNIVKTY